MAVANSETKKPMLPAKRVYTEVRKRLREGDYHAGEQLPTEHAFGAEFGVSRITVAKAMAQLVAEGLVSRHRGRGTFALPNGDNAPASTGGKLITFISPGSSGHPINIRRGITEGLHEVLSDAGYQVVIDYYNNLDQHLRCLSRHTDRQSAGFALWPMTDSQANEQLKQIIAKGFPVVLVDSYLSDVECDYVVTNNVSGAADMVTLLHSLGHRRITYLTEPPKPSSLCDRLTGYLRGLVSNNLPIGANSVVRINANDPAGLNDAVTSLLALPEPPTALFCCNDHVAMPLYWILRERGLNVPQDMTLVGYDDIDAAANFATPLTTVRQDYLEMGRIAARILLERIGRPDGNVHYQKLVPPQLKVRTSSAVIEQPVAAV